MKITKAAGIELTDRDIQAVKHMARIAVLEIENERRQDRSAYERPGLMLDFEETANVYKLAKALCEL